MPDITEPSGPESGTTTRWQRVGWFVLLYLASLVVIGAGTWLLRLILELVYTV